MDRLKLLMDDTDQDLTTQQGVVTLMESSKSEKEWNDNCDEVKEANGGYPNFWYITIMLSGLARRVSSKW